jgi:hypothetical protein
MSFNPNNTNSINLGNYEEFFILYMDKELSPGQVLQVDAFLLEHPDLRVELDMIMGTQLSAPEFSFNKETLMADQMKLTTLDETLYLYIDNELTAEQRKEMDQHLAASPSLQLQHSLLKKTQLNPAEVIPFPEKKSLYRHTEKVIAFGLWMRIAAAVVVIAALGVLYFMNGNGTGTVKPESVAIAPKLQTPSENTITNNKEQKGPEQEVIIPAETVASNPSKVTTVPTNTKKGTQGNQ